MTKNIELFSGSFKFMGSLKFFFQLTDIDECEESNPCHESASCENNQGSFSCHCNDGYLGDGLQCTRM